LAIFTDLQHRLASACTDVEIPRLAQGLTANFEWRMGSRSVWMAIQNGRATLCGGATCPSVLISAEEESWGRVLASPSSPTYHSFTALEIANPHFEVSGEPVVIARCRPTLERIIECVVSVPALVTEAVRRDITLISGRYVPVTIDGDTYDIYVERAGRGMPVLFLHTAGADSRQFLPQLSDVGLTDEFELFSVDMPFHGRSMPPRKWNGGAYKLTKAQYLAWCCAVIEKIIGRPPIVVGGSMGAAISMVLAADRPDLVRGIVAVEPPFQSRGRRNSFQHHVAVHGALHNAAFVRGLMSPLSPECDRRAASWIYSQGAPGIYPGDLAFYSEEFDGAIVGPRIDCKRTPVSLLCGTYDYSASPDDGRKLEKLIVGCRMMVMEGIGHFPMCENADMFRPYLLDALRFTAATGKSAQTRI
jgi:pimeloyl-ACP methyl ester carboxylesterase